METSVEMMDQMSWRVILPKDPSFFNDDGTVNTLWLNVVLQVIPFDVSSVEQINSMVLDNKIVVTINLSSEAKSKMQITGLLTSDLENIYVFLEHHEYNARLIRYRQQYGLILKEPINIDTACEYYLLPHILVPDEIKVISNDAVRDLIKLGEA
ncbi:hypothetical protein D3C78_18700 [compost metagenome]